MPVCPEAFCSWNERPLQAKPILSGKCSSTISSIAAIACPELRPGAGVTCIGAEVYILKRVILPGPVV